MNNDIRRQIIIDNINNTTNKKTIEDDSFVSANTHSDSCIYKVTLFVKFNGNVIEDVYFDGEACAITTSATSIMIQKLIGKTIDEALALMDNYYNMLDEKEYDKDILEELNAYDEMYKQPSRKRCAMLPFETLKKAIIKYKENK